MSAEALPPLSSPTHHVIFFLCCLITKSYLTLCDPMNCNPPVSSVHGISQIKVLEWVALPSSGDLPDPGIELVCPDWQADSCC